MPGRPSPANDDPLRGLEEAARDASTRVRNLERDARAARDRRHPDPFSVFENEEYERKRLDEVRGERDRAWDAFDRARPARDLAVWEKVRGGLLATAAGALVVGSVGYATFWRPVDAAPSPTATVESVLPDLSGAPRPTPTAAPTATPSGVLPAPRLQVDKLLALFEQAKFTTSYATKIENPDRRTLLFRWTGPNCGTWTPQAESTSSDEVIRTAMIWNHPHPPCGTESDHRDVTVTLTVRYLSVDNYPRATFSGMACSYVGSASGSGPECARAADETRTLPP